jgi:hypothetical protein
MSDGTWSRGNRIGLIMTIVLGLANIMLGVIDLPDLLNTSGTVEDGPPQGVLIADTWRLLAGVFIAWTTVAVALTLSRSRAMRGA